MKSRFLLVAGIVGICSTIIFFSCSKSDTGNNGNGGSTDTDSTLVKIGNNVIVPAYQQLNETVTNLDNAVTTFNTNPTAPNLAALRTNFLAAYNAWETCSEFQFGPATSQLFVTNTANLFPTNSTLIDNNINSGSYTIGAIGNLNAEGFPAIDYLLYNGDDATVLAKFTTDVHAAAAKQYLAAITNSLQTKATALYNAWTVSGGNYIHQFTTATGVNAGSSLSLLANAIVQEYDVVLKNYKIGIPIGKYGTSTLPIDPTSVEAYYSGQSIPLMITQIQSIQSLYLAGIDQKVIASGAVKNGSPLNDVIKDEITTIITKLQAINGPLSSAIQNNITPVNDAYTEITKLVVLLKVDMSSALGVRISFSDDDGD
ncbi:imelysin family protein [Ferruginibacter albus]|uniref:imelysin family protein n=1 Tax=Ferruginibacter albus TaxID=2875540 RepID=UPI001CC3465E|nr:imelysin family protein [Ferruginibacter albus]UAY51512.1 imelysin family protein [Ferruginibacter albus]